MRGTVTLPEGASSAFADIIIRRSDGSVYPATEGLFGLLFWFAVFAVVVGAIVAIAKAKGWVIPEVVRIVFWALVSIGMIIFLFRAFSYIF